MLTVLWLHIGSLRVVFYFTEMVIYGERKGFRKGSRPALLSLWHSLILCDDGWLPEVAESQFTNLVVKFFA